MQSRKRQLNTRRNIQLILCTISKTSFTLAIMTWSIERTLLVIIWLTVFGVHLWLKWVSIQEIKTKVKSFDGKSSVLKNCVKLRKKTKTAYSLNNSPQSCASLKTYFFWKLSDHRKSIREKGNSSKPKVSFQVSNDSLAYFYS